MRVLLGQTNKSVAHPTITITGSKSESNRLLVLQALYPNLRLVNLSESDDTHVLRNGLAQKEGIIDILHAGTAMRFLTAYFTSKEGSGVTLTGSERMQERPIAVLVDALQSLGADITYTENEGFPPLKIVGKKLSKASVEIMANISSQYISALLLIAPSLPKGLTLSLEGEITSVPYITMTLDLLNNLGIATTFSENTIKVEPTETIEDTTVIIESDWSSASYFYSLVALSEGLSVTLKSYHSNSLQGDSVVATLYESLGVNTSFNPSEASITLSKKSVKFPKELKLNLSNSPDIAQTIAVTCFALGISCELTGLHTLKIKETDRIAALKTELEKLGAKVHSTEDSLSISVSAKIKEHITVDTYDDHRMAMAFAPLAMKIPITIQDPNVVTKSFPKFWDALAKVGISVDYQ
ncbi:3-phosphoshikimate 1-carboxyvinyltransferase [Ulvibacter sp. MAR_2010_11]|uniref:3-phosphoshikimate 1-carboxyvinyltransferase n=1 Tax=Ulvibacter sp. MAR_2010_11 TaxID=1250229 RepID=UPI000C2BA1BC|nr:3-phosphoshikimate 1-carboxyvinyltransferase [Ulvibacter sp. MAR_2010_11]PKA82387.1 3-phosphoshikimate 1-carboxyvinyltransferase [Ulvibacter sp. MAR_2010_11]